MLFRGRVLPCGSNLCLYTNWIRGEELGCGGGYLFWGERATHGLVKREFMAWYIIDVAA